MQIEEIVHREGEGRWERGEKPKAMVMLKEEGAQEVFDKEMVLNKVMDKEMVLNKRTNRRLERVAIKPWMSNSKKHG